MNKKIAILEFETHAEVLQNLIDLLVDLPFHINLYLSKNVRERITIPENGDQQIEVKLIPKNKSIKKFLKNNLHFLNQNDLIILNTVQSNFFILSQLKFNPPVICRVHNSNTFFNPWPNLFFENSLHSIFKDLIYIVKRQILNLDVIFIPKFLSNVNYFSFPNEVTTQYAIDKKLVDPQKIIPPLPMVYKEKSTDFKAGNLNNDNVTRIAVVGRIEKKRRNYDEVFDAFRQLVPKLENELEFYLLGKPYGAYGNKIVNNFKKLENNKFKLHYYNKFVPFEEFKRVLGICDFQIIPVNKYAKHKIFKEFYGLTKISGNVNDIIRFELPALIPGYYPIEEKLKPLTGQYNDINGLLNRLNLWISDKNFMKSDIEKKLLIYSHSVMKSELSNVLSALIK